MKIGVKIVILAMMLISNVSANITFSNQSSSITVNSSAIFNLHQIVPGWSGTLTQKDGATIAGPGIEFDNGVLNYQDSNSVVTGFYDVTVGAIDLQGNNSVRFEPGQFVPGINVSGTNNLIEGQPFLLKPIVFDGNPLTSLTISIQSPLSQSINLASGTLTLQDDLVFCGTGTFVGPGLVTGPSKYIRLSEQNAVFSQEVSFDGYVGIELNASTQLKNKWRFLGNNTLNGNGNVFELANNGRFSIADGATLYISDAYIKGLTEDRIKFLGPNATLVLSNVTIEFAADLGVTNGKFIINGPTTFVLFDKNITFLNQGRLTVDNTVLWLDVTNNILNTPAGALGVPNPYFVNHQPSGPNIAQGITLGHLALPNNGLIREVIAEELQAGAGDMALTGTGGISGDVTLGQSRFIQPGQSIHVINDATIHGSGSVLVFSKSKTPQFIIDPGVTLRLENLTLSRIYANTFQFGAGSIIEIGKNVTFELEEDQSWTLGQFNLIGSMSNPHVFTIRGLGGVRQLNLNPFSIDAVMFNLGLQTLLLQEIELIGYENISAVKKILRDAVVLAGVIALGGNVNIEINSDPQVSFFVEDENNKLIFVENNLTIQSSIIFGDFLNNSLNIDVRILGDPRVKPSLKLANNAIHLTSDLGRASMIFDNQLLDLENFNASSFVTGPHALIGGNNIRVLTFPIKQLDPDLILDSSINLQSNVSNALDFSMVRSLPARPIITALQRIRETQKEQAIIEKNKYDAMQQALAKEEAQKPKKPNHAGRIKKKKDQRDIESSQEDNYDYKKMLHAYELRVIPPDLLPAFQMPDCPNIFGCLQLASAGGSIIVNTGGKITNFGVGTDQLYLFMRGNATLDQGNAFAPAADSIAAQDTTIKEEDTLFVDGTNNKIIVLKNFTINGALRFDQNAELTFCFDDRLGQPTVYLNSDITLPAGTRLTFRGNGTVVFGDGLRITLESTPPQFQFIDNCTPPEEISDEMNRSSLLFTDLCDATIVDGGIVSMVGHGDIRVDGGAAFRINSDQHLIIGDSIDDDITLTIGNGRLNVESIPFSLKGPISQARLSCQKAALDITVGQNGFIHVGQNGVFEMNALNGSVQAGQLRLFTIGRGGTVEVESTGEIIFGKNRAVGTYRQPLLSTFDFSGGFFHGDGFITFAQTELSGRLQEDAVLENYFTINDDPLTGTITTSPFNIVKILINKVPTLTQAVVFDAQNGHQKVRFPNGNFFELFDTDVITSEDAAVGTIMGTNQGNLVVIYQGAVGGMPIRQ
ncbi:hypothetical protein IPF37_00980 [bacterium]|nr:MAG: hypothetical protein IPF37_00980 [bacterium]